MYLSLPIPLARGSEPICGKERPLKEPFFSRRSSFTYIPLPILSIAQFLPLFLAFKLSLWWPWRGLFFFLRGWWWWEGGCRGDSSGPSLFLSLSLCCGKRAGFSDINGPVGGMTGWCGIGRGRSPLKGLFCTAAVSCLTSGLHLQPQQAWLPHLLPLKCLFHERPHTQSQHNCLWLCRKGQIVWEWCSRCIRGLLVVTFSMTETYCCPVLLTCSDLNPASPHTTASVFARRLGNALQLLTVYNGQLQLYCRKKGKEWSERLKKHTATLVLKGHLFHPTN